MLEAVTATMKVIIAVMGAQEKDQKRKNHKFKDFFFHFSSTSMFHFICLCSFVSCSSSSRSSSEVEIEDANKPLHDTIAKVDKIMKKGGTINNIFKPLQFLGCGGYSVNYRGMRRD